MFRVKAKKEENSEIVPNNFLDQLYKKTFVKTPIAFYRAFIWEKNPYLVCTQLLVNTG